MESTEQLLSTITRGFEGVNAQLKERDDRVARIQENMIRMEGDLKNINTTLSRLDGEISKSENESLKVKVAKLEESIKELKTAQESSSVWVRGLMISVIFLLLGVVFNFVMARVK